jgi:hypothetical protein
VVIGIWALTFPRLTQEAGAQGSGTSPVMPRIRRLFGSAQGKLLRLCLGQAEGRAAGKVGVLADAGLETGTHGRTVPARTESQVPGQGTCLQRYIDEAVAASNRRS